MIFGNGKPGINLASSSATAQRNVIHDNTDGIAVSSQFAMVRDNRIYHNSQAGIRLTSPGSLVTGNSIYANATGVFVVFNSDFGTTTVQNNLIYDHSSAGIEINDTSTSNSPSPEHSQQHHL